MKYFKILFSILIFFIGAQSMSFQFDQFENINSSSPQSKEAEENKSQDEFSFEKQDKKNYLTSIKNLINIGHSQLILSSFRYINISTQHYPQVDNPPPNA